MTYPRMRELINKLNDATKAYDEGKPYMSDLEWDDLYFELKRLEKYNNFTYPDSPTQSIYHQVVAQLNKVNHNHSMLSLDKTKDLIEVKRFCDAIDTPVLVMLKMDGLTCSIEYRNGILYRAETRGNGEVGEDITHNAWVIDSIPKDIPYKGDLTVDGEIICTYQDFKEFEEQYKNPRNFAAGSIRLLDPNECKKRKLTFIAWEVIGFPGLHYLSDKLDTLSTFNFKTVPYYLYDEKSFSEPWIAYMKQEANELGYPIDGIVMKYDDVDLKDELGSTAHHFNNAIAYKFYDEIYTTFLKDIEWTMGRTGVLTPVAFFEPVDIDGTIVERANLHNISVMTEIMGGAFKGQRIEVFKANMIIPQIARAENPLNTNVELIRIPTICPVCGGSTSIATSDSGVMTLVCANPQCEGKIVNQLDHYCSKKGLDIKGLSKATLEKLVDWGWVIDITELYELHKLKTEWIKQAGFGEKSVDKILTAIEESKNCNLIDFIAALGIPLIGKTVAKELVKYIDSYEDFRNKINNNFDFSSIEGFGPAMNSAIHNFNYDQADYIVANYLTIATPQEKESAQMNLKDLKFCITGKLKSFKNRDELKSLIEQNGGKVVGSISASTNYLINNDLTSTSAKNKSAQSLNIPIISEEDFKKLFDF